MIGRPERRHAAVSRARRGVGRDAQWVALRAQLREARERRVGGVDVEQLEALDPIAVGQPDARR